MKTSLQLLWASLAAGSILPRGGYGQNGSVIAEDDFVYTKGLRLYDSDGLHYMTGKPTSLLPNVHTLTTFEE